MPIPCEDLILVSTIISKNSFDQVIQLVLGSSDYININFKRRLIAFYKKRARTFFKKHINKIDWVYLSANPSISEHFFEKHLDKVNWTCLSRNPSLSEAFFEKHLDKVNWPEL